MPTARQLLANSLSRCQPGRESSTQSPDLFARNPEVRRQPSLVAAVRLASDQFQDLGNHGTSVPVPESRSPCTGASARAFRRRILCNLRCDYCAPAALADQVSLAEQHRSLQTWQRYSSTIDVEHPLQGLFSRAVLTGIAEPL